MPQKKQSRMRNRLMGWGFFRGQQEESRSEERPNESGIQPCRVPGGTNSCLEFGVVGKILGLQGEALVEEKGEGASS